MLTLEAQFFINFSDQGKKVCLRLHYNESDSYAFGVKICQFKWKRFEVDTYSLCLESILKYFTVDNMRKTGLHRYVYNFSVDYESIDADDILDIDK